MRNLRLFGEEEGNFDCLIDVPVIEPFSFSKNTKIGQRTYITCSVTEGSVPLDFSWTKDGHPITASNVEIIKSDILSTLSLKPIKSEDGGDYKCLVKNSVGSASHSAVLLIERELLFTSRVDHI